MFPLVNAYLAYLAYLIGKKGREKRIGPVYSPPVNDAKTVGNSEQVGNRRCGALNAALLGQP